jgi:hypothetical protein
MDSCTLLDMTLNKLECSECDVEFLYNEAVQCQNCNYLFCWPCVYLHFPNLECPDCGVCFDTVCLK